jgi:hypothetical protein
MFKPSRMLEPKMLGSIATAVVIAGGLMFLPLKHASGQDAGGKGAPKAGGAPKGGGGGGRGDNASTGPIPRKADGKVDFSGFWERPYTPDMSQLATDMSGKPFPTEDPMHRGTELKVDPNAQAKGGRGGGGRGGRLLPFNASYLKNWQNYDPTNGDYTGACLPFGLMRSINSPDPLQIMQDGAFMVYLFEQNTWFHLFPIDGRPHNKGIPTWFGDSVGHWEGDALVIETVNFNGKTRLDTNGHPHSDQLVLTEKWNRVDLGHVIYEMDVHDPGAFTQDWKIIDDNPARQFKLNNNQHIMEYSCEENNKALYEGRIKPPKYDN